MFEGVYVVLERQLRRLSRFRRLRTTTYHNFIDSTQGKARYLTNFFSIKLQLKPLNVITVNFNLT
jgi:hypothetical protein